MSFEDRRVLGDHISAHFYEGVPGADVGLEVAFCGFCGATVNGEACATTATNLDKTSTTKLISNCSSFPSAGVRCGGANKTSASSPITNLPVLCDEGGCLEHNKTFWQLNIGAHYKTAHAVLQATNIIESTVVHVLSPRPNRRPPMTRSNRPCPLWRCSARPTRVRKTS